MAEAHCLRVDEKRKQARPLRVLSCVNVDRSRGLDLNQ